MKSPYIFLCVALMGCSNSNEPVKNSSVSDTNREKISDTVTKKVAVLPATQNNNCTTDFDTTLLRLAKSFKPNNVALEFTMTPELDRFMLKVDTNCLRKQKKYKLFVSAILAKLALYQIKCCHQHYELRPSREPSSPGAAILLNEFEWILGVQNTRIEFFDSGYVEDYIRKTPELFQDPYLSSILKRIDQEWAKISKGFHRSK